MNLHDAKTLSMMLTSSSRGKGIMCVGEYSRVSSMARKKLRGHYKLLVVLGHLYPPRV